MDAKQLLKNELNEASPSNEHLVELFASLSVSQQAELFTLTCFFRAVLQPLIDQDWLRQHHANPYDPRPQQMRDELSRLSFLSYEIIQATSKQLRTYFNRTTHFLHVLTAFIQCEPTLPEILRLTLKQIDVIVREQDRFPHNHFTESMYRAFDAFDELLGVQYSLDLNMATSESTERLYEGAGIGVQTSYSSILLALDRASLSPGARVLDLGSGYGRVGFALGLLRPDISFTGYEFVDHRNVNANDVARRALLPTTEFVTQDLSDFVMPLADVYYMYDPFSRDTYAKVMNQLISIGRERAVTIITKGRANSWVRTALEAEGWSMDDTCDSGTVCLFRSETVPGAVSAN